MVLMIFNAPFKIKNNEIAKYNKAEGDFSVDVSIQTQVRIKQTVPAISVFIALID